MKKIDSLKWLYYTVRLLDKKPIIICGDFNVGTYYKEEVKKNANNYRAGFTSEEKYMFKCFLSLDLINVLNYKYPSEKDLVDFLTERAKKPDIANGYTLDYIFVSNLLKDKIEKVNILTEKERYDTKHLPIELIINI